jgi:cytochrome c-type biogenesis protein
VSTVASGSLLLAVPVAVAAGTLGFASPCVLPLVPGYLSYVTGMAGASRARLMLGASLFVLGFTAVFVGEGALFGQLGRELRVHERGIEIVLGTFTIAAGLLFAGLFDRLPGAMRQWKPGSRPAAGLAAAVPMGVLFGVGWTPCLGPTVAAIQGLAVSTGTAGRGAVLALFYCAGLGIPFLLVALLVDKGTQALAFLRNHRALIVRGGGALLVLTGVLEVTGLWGDLTRNLTSWFGNGGVGSL